MQSPVTQAADGLGDVAEHPQRRGAPEPQKKQRRKQKQKKCAPFQDTLREKYPPRCDEYALQESNL